MFNRMTITRQGANTFSSVMVSTRRPPRAKATSSSAPTTRATSTTFSLSWRMDSSVHTSAVVPATMPKANANSTIPTASLASSHVRVGRTSSGAVSRSPARVDSTKHTHDPTPQHPTSTGMVK